MNGFVPDHLTDEQDRFEAAAYYDKDGFYMPAAALTAAIREAAEFLAVPHKHYKVVGNLRLIDAPKTLDELWESETGVDVRAAFDKLGNRIELVRPCFEKWKAVAEIMVSPAASKDTLQQLLDHAGQFTGMGGLRGEFGTFTAKEIESEAAQPSRPQSQAASK